MKKTHPHAGAPGSDCAITRAAFVKTLEDVGVSTRSSAPLMFTHASRSQRMATKGFVLPPVRSPRLAIPFAENLLAECRARYGKAG